MATERSIVHVPETDDDGKDEEPIDAGPFPRSETDATRSDTDVKQLVIPTPPFTDSDYPLAPGQTVQCFFDPCDCKCSSYESLHTHIRKRHAGFQKVPPEWNNTPFIRHVQAEKASAATKRRRAKAQAKAAKQGAADTAAVVNDGRHVAQQGSGTASAPQSVQQSLVNVASSFTCGSAEKVIDMPGSSAPLVIPGSVFSDLVAAGLLQVTSTGLLQWIYYLLLRSLTLTRLHIPRSHARAR
mgnify:CR=1 FL=1